MGPRADESKGLSVRAYAAHRKRKRLQGGSPWSVHKAIQSGRIQRNRWGKIDPRDADRQWSEATDPSRNPETSSAGSKVYQESRAIREAFAAKLARLEYEEKAGRLIDADQAQLATFREARIARDRALAIVPRLSAQLAGMNEERAIRRLLREELRAAFERIVEGRRNGKPRKQ